MSKSSCDIYTSQLSIRWRVAYAVAFLIPAFFVFFIDDWWLIAKVLWFSLYALFASFCFFLSTFIQIDGELIKAGIFGIPLVKWKISDISHISRSTNNESWACGLYIGERSVSFAAGPECIVLRNAVTGRQLAVSAKNSAELVERLKNLQ